MISVAHPSDLPSVLSLVPRCIAHMRTRGIDQWDEIYPDEITLQQDLQKNTLYVFRIEGRTIGCAVLNSVQEPEYAAVAWSFRDEPVAVIHRLMIDPGWQGRGIARSFMSFLEARAQEIGMKSIRLDAFMQNPKALGLYDSLGYRRAGQVNFRKGAFYCFEKLCGLEARSVDNIKI